METEIVFKEKKVDADSTEQLGWLAKEVLTFKEALVLLDISSSMLYKLTHKRAIPFYKPGGKLIYFKKTDLLGWALSNKQESVDVVKNDFFNKMLKIK
ncbi:helix-turn-helix domain-containing protein [Flavobacterium sp.]|uniref:helix-turn-helix domain-containing protein n=1 Tax=Flavobacterium sp. TaxID=239 RepID=UPI0028BE0AAD|nr:helix-turn-helix domain-containing protein [Flavobacterium sp.]